MLSSKNMYQRSHKLFTQSVKAFEAEMSIEPFLSTDIAFKMFTTSTHHFVRSAVNFGLACYCIANTIDAAYKEDDSETPVENGLAAIAHHVTAAAIDFANIFFTMGAVLVRAIATLIKQFDSNYSLGQRVWDEGIGILESSISASFTKQGRAYNDASALEFSL